LDRSAIQILPYVLLILDWIVQLIKQRNIFLILVFWIDQPSMARFTLCLTYPRLDCTANKNKEKKCLFDSSFLDRSAIQILPYVLLILDWIAQPKKYKKFV